MKTSTLAILACPVCQQDFTCLTLKSTGVDIQYGALICQTCSTMVPICNGFPLFTHILPNMGPLTLDKLLAFEAKWFGTIERYQQFVQEKQLRPTYDIYAALQPFSEATHSLFPLSEILHENLIPEDYILDTWCRTGWSGEMLAGLFPEQQVISIWEGNHDCLGFAGFRYWLNGEKRASNLDILFLSLEKSLPFKSKAFKFSHAFDTLHRYSPVPLHTELLRITKEVIAFPHVHLGNSEPEPYFDREGPHYHGKEYQAYFKQLLRNTQLQAWVLSEKALFNTRNTFTLQDDADTTHYNGLVLLAASKWQGQTLQKRLTDSIHPASRIIINPLLRIDLQQASIAINTQALAGKSDDYLQRHPLYFTALQKAEGFHLSLLQCQILYYAQRLLSIAEIAERLQLTIATLISELNELRDNDIVQIYITSFGMQQLQHFYATQKLLTAFSEHHFATLWAALPNYSDNAILIHAEDDSHFYKDDVQTIVYACCHFFLALGLKPGDHIVIHAHNHVEYLCCVWAAWLCGFIVIPIDAQLPAHTVAQLIKHVSAKLILTDSNCVANIIHSNIPYYLFDALETTVSENTLAQHLPKYISQGAPNFCTLTADTPAAILFTSGSTGMPKGVLISHGSLYRSSQTLIQSYAWQSGDRYLVLSGMHTMSGLRNPAVAAFMSGTTLVVPPSTITWHPRTLWDLCTSHKISILLTVPALLKQLITDSQSIFPLPHLKQILCTGAPLASDLCQKLSQRLQTSIYNYYGLTETGGICILNYADYDEPDCIGKPQGVIAQIVDANNQVVKQGQVGELRIFGDQLMLGYFKQAELTSQRLRQGWLYTGDLAFFNSTGGIVLIGRSDEQKKDTRGESFHLNAIERLLESHPAVQEASIVDLAKNKPDYQLAAFIISHKPSPDLTKSLPEFIRQFVAHDKIPQQYFLVTDLPRGSNGKVLKNILIEEYMHYANPVAST